MKQMTVAIQIILGVMFTLIGAVKSFVPEERLIGSMPWIELFPNFVLQLVGISELLGGLALLIPLLSKRFYRLSSLSALGIMIIMVLAALLHMSRPGETVNLIANVVIFLLAGLVMIRSWNFGRARSVVETQ